MTAIATLVLVLLAFALRSSRATVLRQRGRGTNGSSHLMASDVGGKQLSKRMIGTRSNESSVWPWGGGRRELRPRGGNQTAAPIVTMEEQFLVNVTKDFVYGQGLSCNQNYTDCVPYDLLVDVYDPQMDSTETPRPSMVVVHGGSEEGGSRTDDPNSRASAKYFAARGFVVFNIDYRLLQSNGLFPCQPSGCECDPEIEWWRNPCMIYPAVRDYKAAVRWVRANSARFNIDKNLIVANGGSAGATNILVAGYAAENLYKDELLLEDETLASTNLDESSLVRMAVLHWPYTNAIEAGVLAYGAQSFLQDQSVSVLQFHGSIDPNANSTDALAFADTMRERGAHYHVVLLDGCAHKAWCGSPFNDNRTCDSLVEEADEVVEACACKLGCTRQDEYALPIIAEELGLQLL
eukprot:TRINITY_DN1877_c0_g1_i17.p1 TRINITY_DN1877_c0_g1~~TRINITY_DN1877_c0_g1_i17.p1  ORF type:complete len:407 (-),score=49.37 TRINITY_DN1877_c0_g1_i17:62-1282(-)